MEVVIFFSLQKTRFHQNEMPWINQSVIPTQQNMIWLDHYIPDIIFTNIRRLTIIASHHSCMYLDMMKVTFLRWSCQRFHRGPLAVKGSMGLPDCHTNIVELIHMCNVIIHPCLNFYGKTTLEVRTCMAIYIPLFYMDLNTYPSSNPDVGLADLCYTSIPLWSYLTAGMQTIRW